MFGWNDATVIVTMHVQTAKSRPACSNSITWLLLLRMNHSTIAYRCCICTLVLSSNYPRLEDAEVIPTDTSVYGTVDSYNFSSYIKFFLTSFRCVYHTLLYAVRSSSFVWSRRIYEKAVKVNCYKTASPPRTEIFHRVRQEALINAAPSIVLFIAATRVCPETACRSVQPLVQRSQSWPIQTERQRHTQRNRQTTLRATTVAIDPGADLGGD